MAKFEVGDYPNIRIIEADTAGIARDIYAQQARFPNFATMGGFLTVINLSAGESRPPELLEIPPINSRGSLGEDWWDERD